tara:strand:- start:123 stop:557 length:435 start_codon:yes stop_codon:yes gene_type:complete
MAFALNTFAQSPFSSLVNDNTNITVTGIALAMQEGNASAFTDVTTEDLTGIGFNINLGNITAPTVTIGNIVGINLTMQEGQVTAPDASAELTGIVLNLATGTLQTVIWNPINPGTPGNWTEVSKGTPGNWTEVSKGTPGTWRPV